jgi:protein-L-isoaspartate(D-aspartate) O-methyltransferase
VVNDDFERRRRRMVRNEGRHGGVTDPRVLDAMATVPREEFVPGARREDAYDERALPIDDGQTISQPLIVALMTQALDLAPGDRVLEIGTGSGYQAAVLRRLVDHVVTVERIDHLARGATATLERLGVDGVEVHCADGTLGWPDGAPYDAIVVTAGAPHLPGTLLDQLAPGGRLVIPVGPRGDEHLVRVTMTDRGPVRNDLGPVAFVPLIGDEGWQSD